MGALNSEGGDAGFPELSRNSIMLLNPAEICASTGKANPLDGVTQYGVTQ